MAIATFCLPPDVVEFAARAGFSVAEVLAGVLTPEVIATLPVAAALARKARY